MQFFDSEPSRTRLPKKRTPIPSLLAWLLIPLAVLFASTAQAQTPIGTAVGVLPAATAELGGQTVTMITGDQIIEGQTITTDTTGEVQIVFADNTRMVVGPNSSMVIERYLLRNPETVEDLTVNLLGGTFRFLSGNSPSESYTVNTPTGTVGVRGTWWDGWITATLSVFMLYDGLIIACPLFGTTCIFIDLDCSIATLTPEEAAVVRNEGERVEIANTEGFFPYALFQEFLLAQFQVEFPEECLEDRDATEEEEEEEETSSEPGSSEASSESSESSECVSEGCGSEISGFDPDYPCDNAPVSCVSEPSGPECSSGYVSGSESCVPCIEVETTASCVVARIERVQPTFANPTDRDWSPTVMHFRLAA